jgi:hypothetical protein
MHPLFSNVRALQRFEPANRIRLRQGSLCQNKDKYKKYELSIKPGQYIITNLLEKIKMKVQTERKELKSGKKTFVLADLTYESTVL